MRTTQVSVRELIVALVDKGFVCNVEGAEKAAEMPTQPDTAAVTEVEEVSEEADTTEHGATQPDTAAVTDAGEVSEESETTADTATQPDTAENAESVDSASQ